MVNWPAWLIFDQRMLNNRGFMPAAPGQPLPPGLATQANSLSDLAEMVGIDSKGFHETVERFNGFCKDGVDPDFGRGTVPWGCIMTGNPKLKNPCMGEVSQAPFYAVTLQRVTMGVPTAGLPIDGDGRVVDAGGKIVPGLYATGNSAAWQDWAAGDNSGIAGMRGMIYGHRGGLHMTAT